MPRIFAAGFITETNTFSPVATTYEDFKATYLSFAGQHDITKPNFWAAPLVTFAELAQTHNWEYVESLCASAEPGGKIEKKVYEQFKQKILLDLEKNLPVDMILLNLHGASVAEDYDDCEGDLLSAIRKKVGKSIPIGVELDLHANISQQMIENADILISYKEYPHTDIVARAKEVFKYTTAMMLGNLKPQISLVPCHMIISYPTILEPMRGFVSKMQKLEEEDPDIISISLAHGFPWSDVSFAGTKLLVITNGNPKKGQKIATQLSQELINMRTKITLTFRPLEYAIEQAKNYHAQKPLVLADFADNAGGGAAGDTTHLLRSVLENQIKHVGLSSIFDPEVVKQTIKAGVGQTLSIFLGGKLNLLSGQPIKLKVVVKNIKYDMKQNRAGYEVKMGDCVALTVPELDLDIVVNSIRTQTFSAECFTQLGIDPKQKKILIVKSSTHFRESFQVLAGKILVVAAQGVLNPNITELPYKKIPKTLWPFVG